MPYDFGNKQSMVVGVNGESKRLWREDFIDSFNSSQLKVGKFGNDSKTVRCICAIFDLEGFTHFCSQSEPELFAGRFLKEFFEWLFQEIRNETIVNKYENSYEIYHDLPFYSKFLGDGALFLWDTESMSERTQHNLIISLDNICRRYEDEFYQATKNKYIEIPKKIRCGLTKGSVYSIGDKNDFIGPCINLASRLQSMPGVLFAFCRKGFDPESNYKDFDTDWIKKRVSIRGYTFDEIIVLRKNNYEEMNADDKLFYKDF